MKSLPYVAEANALAAPDAAPYDEGVPAPEVGALADLQARLQAAVGDAYRIQKELGGGGMSRLFLASEASLERQVVIKLLPPEFTSEVSAARFQQETTLAAHLQHPNILPVLTAGTKDDLLYYIMPFVPGESLRHQLTREGKLPVADAAQILHDVADALAYAHAQGVIHRDVKPENILLLSEHAVLSDFGVARALAPPGGGERLTETGISVGTPAYMSPEQAAGERHVDARADVYALAVVGYEMLTGALPFAGPTAQAVIAARLVGRPKPLTDLRPDTPPPLADAIMQALATDPDARLRTAAHFRDAIHRPALGAASRARRWRTAPLMGAGALLGAVIVGGALLYRNQARLRWVREQALPQMRQLAEQQRPLAAFHLLQQAQHYAPNDPAIESFASQYLSPYSIRTKPSGADAYVKEYTDLSGQWEYMGKTPVENRRLPPAHFRMKLIKTGYDTAEGSNASIGGFWVEFVLDSIGTSLRDMVHIPAGSVAVGSQPEVKLEEFLINKYEVTNHEFKQFVDAGGYRDRRYWKVPFFRHGAALTWEQAMALFRDKTDRPGPATWELGSYLPGEEDFPVGGVSWYEAAAYAEFASRALPTVYHWYRAARMGNSSDILQLSNFSGRGPARVGSYRASVLTGPMIWQAMSRSGASTLSGSADTSLAVLGAIRCICMMNRTRSHRSIAPRPTGSGP